MRPRILIPLLLCGVIAVIAILVPIAESIAVNRTQQLISQRARTVDQISQRAEQSADGAREGLRRYVERFHEVYGEPVVVVDDRGRTIARAGRLAEGTDVDALVLAAVRTVPRWTIPTIYPWGARTVPIAEPLSSGGAVIVEVDLAAAQADVVRGWALAGAIGLALLLALGASSLLLTRWILRPVAALDDAVNEMTRRHASTLAPATGPPELRRLADSFRRMETSMRAALEQQRAFVADASHQLRNPLAAARLRLDALAEQSGGGMRADTAAPHDAGSPHDTALAATVLDELDADLDRLDRTVHRMLNLAEAEHRAESAVTLGEAALDDRPGTVISAAELTEPSRALLAEHGIALQLPHPDTEVAVACRRDDLEEMLEIVLDNAAKYAGSGSTVRVEVVDAPDGAPHVEVSDDGPGLSDEELASVGTRFWRARHHTAEPGSGLGIAIVRELARANDAEVRFDRSPQGGLRVTLVFGAP
ncbi:HAMP domain-containing sensor histidine kinase [Schumannella sp. 10F1B-5-1]|uniref:HAMP domain-containing sensor histidine kinase n=1 Tax=Schumannella sp. 10F1B-5-1 TaxID=2590780 RepID=UPI0011320149|nr:HAMP domain-containing sensor histidine kinase [Schumannella sp. 10F1B-5-1]TPW76872.1 HAMP domain-containing histidine kinase [Schumannella sp. 10F1B-5-1]